MFLFHATNEENFADIRAAKFVLSHLIGARTKRRGPMVEPRKEVTGRKMSALLTTLRPNMGMSFC